MKKLAAGLAVLAVVLLPNVALAAPWTSGVTFTTQVASTPFRAGGYPVPPGQTAPDPGTCRLGDYNANRSESWIAANPGTEVEPTCSIESAAGPSAPRIFASSRPKRRGHAGS